MHGLGVGLVMRNVKCNILCLRFMDSQSVGQGRNRWNGVWHRFTVYNVRVQLSTGNATNTILGTYPTEILRRHRGFMNTNWGLCGPFVCFVAKPKEI